MDAVNESFVAVKSHTCTQTNTHTLKQDSEYEAVRAFHVALTGRGLHQSSLSGAAC